MIPVGYLYKRVAPPPASLKASAISDIYSVSGCIAAPFTDYIQYWQHNGYWLFNAPLVMATIAQTAGIDLAQHTLFYYEAYEYEFDEATKTWLAFAPEPAFMTAVQVPNNPQLAGFDIVTFSLHTGPECSPLSCNALATTLQVNAHCLFHTFVEAKAALENGLFTDAEPGPYRIFAVYTLGLPENAA